jgi:hypothetical protein
MSYIITFIAGGIICAAVWHWRAPILASLNDYIWVPIRNKIKGGAP